MPRPSRISPAGVTLAVGAVLVLLTPLGLLAPGGAFGEDSPEDLDLGELGLHAVPAGLDEYAGFWSHTLLGGYGFSSGDHANLGYVLSAVLGILVVMACVYVIGRVVRALGGAGSSTDERAPELQR